MARSIRLEKLFRIRQYKIFAILVSECVNVGSHDPISIQLTSQIFVCMKEHVGVHTIQFLHQLFREHL